jgi:hypothetical protein
MVVGVLVVKESETFVIPRKQRKDDGVDDVAEMEEERWC